MLAIPELTQADVSFGNIKHMPQYETLPEEFREGRGPYVKAVSHWFFEGAKREGATVIIDGQTFKAREGVDTVKALRAIGAVLQSFDPPHEVKEAACAFMLSEWFEAR